MRPIPRRRRPERKALVVGRFSVPFGGASAGDLAALEVAQRRLDEQGLPYDVALADPFEGGLEWQGLEPEWYSHLVQVGTVPTELLERFASCRRVELTAADLAFAALRERVPVAGVLLGRPPAEEADRAAWKLLAERPCAALALDARMDVNDYGLRSRAELEAVVSRLDVVVTTAAEGIVFALRSGVPALALVPAEAETAGWPAVVAPGEATPERLAELWSWCLTAEARDAAKACAERAAQSFQERSQWWTQ